MDGLQWKKGNPYLLASDDYTEKISDFIADYNARDTKKVLAHYTTEYVERNGKKLRNPLQIMKMSIVHPLLWSPLKSKVKMQLKCSYGQMKAANGKMEVSKN